MIKIAGKTKDIIWVRDTVNADKNRLAEVFAYEDSNGNEPASLILWPRTPKGTPPREAMQKSKTYIKTITTGLDLNPR